MRVLDYEYEPIVPERIGPTDPTPATDEEVQAVRAQAVETLLQDDDEPHADAIRSISRVWNPDLMARLEGAA